MNKESLLYLSQNTNKITANDAVQLEQLTVKFPYFVLPFQLLAKYYFNTQDYRYENTLNHAAIRTNNRNWLFDFIHNDLKEAVNQIESRKEISSTENVDEINLAENQTENNSSLDFNSAIPDLVDDLSLNSVNNSPSNSNEMADEGVLLELNKTENTDNKNDTDFLNFNEQSPQQIDTNLTINNNDSETIAALPKIIESKEENKQVIDNKINLAENSELRNEINFTEASEKVENLEFEVFEEIDGFHIGNDINSTINVTEDPAIELENSKNDELETDENHNHQKEQITAAERIDELNFLLEKISYSVEPDLESYHIEKVPIVSSEIAINDPIIEEEQTIVRPKNQGFIYNIEDYFPKDLNADDDENVKDFFGWLRNPNPTLIVKKEEPKPNKTQAIIDSFIAKNPSIQRPKQDFFTPNSAAKKSEELPDDLVSETLAQIFSQQGNIGKAIEIYEKLSLKFPEKSSYFASLIKNLSNKQ